MIELQHCVDILLNTYARDTVVEMVDKRARERKESAKIVAALPPGIEQRTPAWYAARKGLLTASEFKIAGAANVSQSYVLGKVFPAAIYDQRRHDVGLPLRRLCVRDIRNRALHARQGVRTTHTPGPTTGWARRPMA